MCERPPPVPRKETEANCRASGTGSLIDLSRCTVQWSEICYVYDFMTSIEMYVNYVCRCFSGGTCPASL